MTDNTPTGEVKRINVAVNPETVEMLAHMIDRDQVSLTEAARVLMGVGDAITRLAKDDGRRILAMDTDGDTTEVVVMTNPGDGIREYEPSEFVLDGVTLHEGRCSACVWWAPTKDPVLTRAEFDAHVCIEYPARTPSDLPVAPNLGAGDSEVDPTLGAGVRASAPSLGHVAGVIGDHVFFEGEDAEEWATVRAYNAAQALIDKGWLDKLGPIGPDEPVASTLRRVIEDIESEADTHHRYDSATLLAYAARLRKHPALLAGDSTDTPAVRVFRYAQPSGPEYLLHPDGHVVRRYYGLEQPYPDMDAAFLEHEVQRKAMIEYADSVPAGSVVPTDSPRVFPLNSPEPDASVTAVRHEGAPKLDDFGRECVWIRRSSNWKGPWGYALDWSNLTAAYVLTDASSGAGEVATP